MSRKINHGMIVRLKPNSQLLKRNVGSTSSNPVFNLVNLDWNFDAKTTETKLKGELHVKARRCAEMQEKRYISHRHHKEANITHWNSYAPQFVLGDTVKEQVIN
jgi:hypothetical protein